MKICLFPCKPVLVLTYRKNIVFHPRREGLAMTMAGNLWRKMESVCCLATEVDNRKLNNFLASPSFVI